MTRWLAGFALVTLAGCGGAESESGAGAGAGSGASAADRWNALDACATVGAANVAAAAGSAVTGAELGPKSEGGEGRAGFSMCTFALASGARLTAWTREAPDGDGIEAAVAEARRAGEELDSPTTDVPGLGQAAIWTDKPPSLQVFLDDRRYLTISTFGGDLTPDGSGKARAVAERVARKLLS